MSAVKQTAAFNDLSHHAYLLIGDIGVYDEVISILGNRYKIQVHGNSDFFTKSYEVFTIEDARELKALHTSRPVTDTGYKIFVLHVHSITIEAQNALLKLFEEPAEYARFFVVIPSRHMLIDTIISRMQESTLSSDTNRKHASGEQYTHAEKFVEATIPQRLEIVKKISDDLAKERKTKQDVIDFLNEVQAVIYDTKGISKGEVMLKAIETARQYMYDRAPSVKMLLEYVALHVY